MAIGERQFGQANGLAKRYVTEKDHGALDEAAELLATCISPQEEKNLLWWWDEGARNSAKSSSHLEEINAALLIRRKELDASGAQ